MSRPLQRLRRLRSLRVAAVEVGQSHRRGCLEERELAELGVALWLARADGCLKNDITETAAEGIDRGRAT